MVGLSQPCFHITKAVLTNFQKVFLYLVAKILVRVYLYN